MPGVEKHYFVFTDDEANCRGENVTVYHKECEGFPKDSLFKFDMFLRAEDELRGYDYVYFINSNAEFKRRVEPEEWLPDGENGLVGADWPGRRKPLHLPMFFPYERRRKSRAYVGPWGKDYHYYLGGLNGGTSEAYLRMIRELAEATRDDYGRGIVALVHDESHVNRYFREHKPRSLGNEYCWPEEWEGCDEPKMILRDKVKVDAYFNKGRKSGMMENMRKLAVVSGRAIRWYLKV